MLYMFLGSASVEDPIPTVTVIEGAPPQPHPVVPTIAEEQLSEISDGEGYLHPPDDDPLKIDMATMRLSQCKIKSIRGLYINHNEVN